MNRMLQWLSDWQSGVQDREFLTANGGLGARDLGLSTCQADGLTSAPADTRARMEAMAARFGLPASVIDEERWRAADIANACGHCGERRRCSSFLKDGEATPSVAEAFCPNSATYAELAKTRSA